MSGLHATTHGSYDLGPSYQSIGRLDEVPCMQAYFKKHGYLTIALAPVLLPDLIVVENCSQIVNYGIEKLRLREPVRSGSRVRLGATIKGVRRVPGGAQRLSLAIRFEIEGVKRPACTGELIFVYFE